MFDISRRLDNTCQISMSYNGVGGSYYCGARHSQHLGCLRVRNRVRTVYAEVSKKAVYAIRGALRSEPCMQYTVYARVRVRSYARCCLHVRNRVRTVCAEVSKKAVHSGRHNNYTLGKNPPEVQIYLPNRTGSCLKGDYEGTYPPLSPNNLSEAPIPLHPPNRFQDFTPRN